MQDVEAIEKMTKGILGEHEGLKSLGISINETNLKRKMAEMGIKGEFAALDEVTKAQVRYAIMLDQTKNAQGDAIRSADSYTNKVKKMEAKIYDIKEAIGRALIPAMSGVLDVVLKVTDGIAYFVDGLIVGTQETGSFAYSLGLIFQEDLGIQWLADICFGMDQFTETLINATAESGNLLTGLTTAFEGIGFDWAVDLVTKVQDIINVFEEVKVIEEFKTLFEDIFLFCLQVWEDTAQPIWDALMTAVDLAVETFRVYFPIIMDVFKLAMDMIKKLWDTIGKPVFDIIMSLVKKCQEVFSEYMPKYAKVFKDMVNTVKEQWNKNLKPVFDQIKKFIEKVLAPAFEWVFDNVIRPLIKGTFEHIKNMWEKSLKPVFEGICEFLNGVFTGNWKKAWEGVVKVFKGIFNGIVQIAKKPINSVITMVNKMIRGLNKIKLPDWVPGIGGKGINIPEIPKLATGGIAVKSTIANIGEAGTEAIVPLSNKSKMKPFAVAVADLMPDSKKESSGSDSGVTINISGLSVREEADVQKIAQELYKIQDRNRRRRGVVYA